MGKIRLLHVKEYMANVVMCSILTNSVFSDEACFTDKKGQDIVMSRVSLESGVWTYLVNTTQSTAVSTPRVPYNNLIMKRSILRKTLVRSPN